MAWGDLWKCYAIHLTWKTPQIMQVKRFKSSCGFKTTCETAWLSRGCIFEKPPSIWRASLYRSHACHFIGTVVEMVGGPGQSGSGRTVDGPDRMLNFCCMCLKMQRVMLNLRLDVDSLVIVRTQVHRVLRCRAEPKELMGGSNVPQWDDPTEKGQIVPKAEGEVAQKKDISQKTPKKQKIMVWEWIQHRTHANKNF